MNGLTRREREVLDLDTIKLILDTSKVVHIGMTDGDEPYVVPMNYGYCLNDGKLTIYLHGAKRGKKLDIIRKNPKVFVEMECNIQPFEGEVACKYGISYLSLMGKGIAEIIEDTNEKQLALTALMKTQTEKDFSFDEKMVSIVSIIKIDISQYTAKFRPFPKNQDK